MKAFIIAGQSNALGISPVAGLEGKDYTYPEIMMYQSCNVPVPNGDCLKPLAPGFGADATKFGLELGLAEKLYPVLGKMLFIKYASDGTSLYDRWNAAPRGVDYSALLETVKKACTAVFEPVELEALFWMQGSNDASFEEQANVYYENLKTFVEKIGVDLGKEKLPVVIGQINPNNKVLRFVKQVNIAQRRVCEEKSYAYFTDTSDISDLIDNYHYTAACELELGRRMAEKYLTEIKK